MWAPVLHSFFDHEKKSRSRIVLRMESIRSGRLVKKLSESTRDSCMVFPEGTNNLKPPCHCPGGKSAHVGIAFVSVQYSIYRPLGESALVAI